MQKNVCEIFLPEKKLTHGSTDNLDYTKANSKITRNNIMKYNDFCKIEGVGIYYLRKSFFDFLKVYNPKKMNFEYLHWTPFIMRSAIILFCLHTLCMAQGPLPTFQPPVTSNAQESSERLFSPSVGQKFYEIAYELANAPKLTKNQAQQAMIFLTATTNLDSRAKYVLTDMIKLASQDPDQDYSELLRKLLESYVDESADLEIARAAIGYLMARLDSREQREQFLAEMLKTMEKKNKVLTSELATMLGLLMAEKTDLESAKMYLMGAYDNNKYNRLAFAKLTELMGQQIEPAVNLEHLRLALGENPLDIETALAFAKYAQRLQLYSTAADAYGYCADLFSYLYPTKPVPAYIYLPWAVNSYNTPRNQYKCLQIATEIRQTGHFDLLLEAIAGKAAAKIGNLEKAKQILKAAEEKATQFLSYELRTTNYEQLAWFYCFASPDADRALDWANKAYSADPNSATAAAILAYSLVINNQTDWAKPLIDTYQRNQIADLALAKIQLAAGQKGSALETLNAAIARDPGSIEAEQAKQLLTEQGSEYIAPVATEVIATAMISTFGPAIVPRFAAPGKTISLQFNLRGNKFSYGNRFGGSVAITNNSSEPLIISDNGLITGRIRIDAEITGDLSKKIPELVSTKVQPSLPVEPGRSFIIPVRLVTGRLREILLTHPQASLDIEFTVYLDPLQTNQGPINRIADIEPAKVVASRPGKILTTKYLQNRFNGISKGRQQQKIDVAKLFIGLLNEQNDMANREPLYKLMDADWMLAMLKSALAHSLSDDDWVARAHIMADMLSLPLDYELINAVADNLNDIDHWPARMMAIYLLTKAQNNNFKKVLDHIAKYDSSQTVRDMAIALGAAAPKPKQQPEEPTTVDLEEILPEQGW